MRKQILLFLFILLSVLCTNAQTGKTDSLRNAKKDSTLRALMHADSLKVNREFAELERMDRIKPLLVFPLLKGGDFSGVVPVADPTEVPDPNMDYKLLFELTSVNPDSIAKDLNAGLVEIARKINLHVASGISAKRIFPVVVVHAAAIHALKNNVAYQKKYKMDNPNIGLIHDLEQMGARFIVCGQAMAFFDIKKEELLPDMRISLTAQTALSQYQLKGYVLFQLQ
jgi:intracellular sulfur oxidation DsrE/DsrF family protein